MAIQDRIRPYFFVTITAKGIKTKVDVTDRVLRFTYHDSEKKADTMTLDLDNFDMSFFDDPLWQHGNTIEFTWGYPGNPAPTRTAVIKTIKGFHKLHVEAHSKAMLLHQNKKSRSWKGKRFTQIAKIIAEEYGYDAQHQFIERVDPELPSITQAHLTDAALLKHLSHKHAGGNFVFYIDFDGFHFHSRQWMQKPIRVLQYYTDKESGDINDITFNSDHAFRPGKHVYNMRQGNKKKNFSHAGSNDDTTHLPGTAEFHRLASQKDGGPDFLLEMASEHHHTATQHETAKKKADGKYASGKAHSVKVDIKMIGDPSLVAKSIIELRGVGRTYSGKYYVKDAMHTIDANQGYYLELSCIRDGHSELGIKAKTKKNDKNADGEKFTGVHVADQVAGELVAHGTHVEYRDVSGALRAVENPETGQTEPIELQGPPAKSAVNPNQSQ